MDKAICFIAALGFACGAALAQDSPAARIQKDLYGSWIVDVEGEARSRTLNVRGAEAGKDGAWALDTTYGWSDGNQTPVNTTVVVKPEGYTLTLVTQANSRITAELLKTSLLHGTFTWSTGVTKPVTLERFPPDEIKAHGAAMRATRMKAAMKAPGPGVSPECAAWLGGWDGRWMASGGSTSPVTFWVTEVKQDAGGPCNLTFQASSGLGTVPKPLPVEGRASKEYLCNDSTLGYCIMKMSSDGTSVDISYRSSQGGYNYAPMKKLALN